MWTIQQHSDTLEGGKSVNKTKITCRWYAAKANCMVRCIPSRPRRKGNSFSEFMWTMSFPENSRRPFPASPLAPLLGKSKCWEGCFSSLLTSAEVWGPVNSSVDQCDLLLQSVIVTTACTAHSAAFERKYSCGCATTLKSTFQQSHRSDQTLFHVLLTQSHA